MCGGVWRRHVLFVGVSERALLCVVVVCICIVLLSVVDGFRACVVGAWLLGERKGYNIMIFFFL